MTNVVIFDENEPVLMRVCNSLKSDLMLQDKIMMKRLYFLQERHWNCDNDAYMVAIELLNFYLENPIYKNWFKTKVLIWEKEAEKIAKRRK